MITSSDAMHPRNRVLHCHRKRRYRMVYVLLLMAITSLGCPCLAQSGNLAGQWTVDLTKTLDSMNVQEKARYDSMPNHVRQRFHEAFHNRTFAFDSSGNVTVSFDFKGQARAITGTWSYAPNGSCLTINTEYENRSYDVRWFGLNSLQLQFRSVAGRGTFTSLFLVRED